MSRLKTDTQTHRHTCEYRARILWNVNRIRNKKETGMVNDNCWSSCQILKCLMIYCPVAALFVCLFATCHFQIKQKQKCMQLSEVT